jgi:2-aminoethylphosphonate aminotransferase
MKSPKRKVLLNPGPATTSQGVKEALVITDVCPREQSFCDLYADVRRRLAELAGDPAEIAAIPVVGSGTTAMEAMIVSLVPANGGLVIIDNGDYGTRFAKLAAAHQINHHVVEAGWGQSIDLEALDRELAGLSGMTHLVFIHHETSSGLLNPLEALTTLGRKHGLSVMVDAMSSFGCLPMRVGEGGIDTLVSSSNKCVQGMAGLGIVITTRAELERARAHDRRCFVLDLVAEQDHLEATGQSRFTVPPQVVSALHQALLELEQESLSGRQKRYAESMSALTSGLAELGFELLLEPEQQSRILVAIREPEQAWYDFEHMHAAMDAAGFTIYPGKPGAAPTFRLAVLGDIDSGDIRSFLEALRGYLDDVRR